jgi:hypothetical protein
MTNKQVITSTYVPRSLAMDFHARSERFAVVVAHRRFGKTVMCVNDLIDKAIQCPLMFPQYSYIAPFYSQAKAIAWMYLKHYAAPITERVMESELSVVLKNGAKIRLFGADNPDSLRGLYHDGVIIDEYGQISPRLFGEIVAPALSDRKGWVVFIGTPAGPNHFKELWDQSLNDSRWYRRMYDAYTTKIIDDEELEALRTMPGADENTFRQEMLCDFSAAIRGAYYGDQLNAMENASPSHMTTLTYDTDRPVHLSFDIGYSDDTSIWMYQTDGKRINVLHFFTVSGYSVDDVLSYLSSLPYAYGTFHLPHDAKNKSFQTGKSVRELMIAAGCKTQLVPNMSIQDGIQAVRATLPNVWFNTADEGVRQGLNALRVYQREWDDKRRVFKESPKHDWSSNPADSFRYLALAVNPGSSKRESRVITNKTPSKVFGSNVVTLDNLYRDRAAAASSGPYKRI